MRKTCFQKWAPLYRIIGQRNQVLKSCHSWLFTHHSPLVNCSLDCITFWDSVENNHVWLLWPHCWCCIKSILTCSGPSCRPQLFKALIPAHLWMSFFMFCTACPPLSCSSNESLQFTIKNTTKRFFPTNYSAFYYVCSDIH